MFKEEILRIANRMTYDELWSCHPNDILQMGAALSESDIEFAKWEIIKSRTILLTGLIIAKSF